MPIGGMPICGPIGICAAKRHAHPHLRLHLLHLPSMFDERTAFCFLRSQHKAG
jgi:hypothetical protein